MRKGIILFALAVPALVLASSGHTEESRYLAQTGRESDFWPRVINFSIFAGFLYYMISTPIKEYFNGRSQAIANRLDEIQKRLDESKKLEEAAMAKLESSKRVAKEILDDAASEAELVAKKIASAAEEEISNLAKQFDEKQEIELRKAKREVVAKVLNEKIDEQGFDLDAAKSSEIIKKRVA